MLATALSPGQAILLTPPLSSGTLAALLLMADNIKAITVE